MEQGDEEVTSGEICVDKMKLKGQRLSLVGTNAEGDGVNDAISLRYERNSSSESWILCLLVFGTRRASVAYCRNFLQEIEEEKQCIRCKKETRREMK